MTAPRPHAAEKIAMGQALGHLIALRRDGAYWQFKCICGTEKRLIASEVLSGRIVSCGCQRTSRIRRLGLANRTHGATNTSEYNIWRGILARCTNPADAAYKNYGGRGITVCARWRESFEAFYTDMGARPAGKCIERENNDGPYEPKNCRWATAAEQANNRRTNHRLEFRGKSLTVKEWAIETCIDRSTITKRLKYGWAVERALTEAVETKFRSAHSARDAFGWLA